ncbi:hypothetical protein EBS02_10615, partial [bacterium]|nr:hypothetical protein [bacterium]
RNFQEQKILYIPKIYWDYTCTELLVMEEVSGLSVKQIFSNPLSDSHQKLLSQNIFLIFLKQVFEHSFFHADMHPGNIFIDLDTLSEPRYIFVDFGIIGTLSDKDQRYLAENLLAFFEQDYRKVALLHLQSGWVQPNISLSHFEFSIRAVCEPIFQRPLKDISVGETFLKLIKVAQQHKIIIQPQLILLQKTILAVEGLSRRLCPELDLWTAIYPYVKNAVRMKFGLVGELRKTWTRLPLLLEKFNQDHSLETLNKLKKRYQYSAWLFIDGLYWISILFNTSLYVMGSYRSFEEYIMIIALHVIVILIIKNRHKEI